MPQETSDRLDCKVGRVPHDMLGSSARTRGKVTDCRLEVWCAGDPAEPSVLVTELVPELVDGAESNMFVNAINKSEDQTSYDARDARVRGVDRDQRGRTVDTEVRTVAWLRVGFKSNTTACAVALGGELRVLRINMARGTHRIKSWRTTVRMSA